MLSYLLAALESEEDKRRFTELYEENHVRAEQTALRILRDPHDAEDAVQNAFLQVIHHFDEISEIPCKKLGFWIISIVKNEALMILRRKQKELPQENWDTFSADVSDPTSYNELVRLFSQLPPTYRAALGNAADQRLLRQGNCTASWDLRVRGQYAHFSWSHAAS